MGTSLMDLKNDTGVENQDEQEQEFRQLLDDYMYTTPKRGEIIEGEIETIQEDSIILNVGAKRAAIVNPREVKNMNDEEIEGYSVGDVIPVYITRTPVGSDNLVVSIERAAEYHNWVEAEKLLTLEETVELAVVGWNRGGLLVTFDQLEGFIPNSHIPELRRIRNPGQMEERKQEMIGTCIQVKTIEVDRKQHRLVFSIRLASTEQQAERLKELSVGDVVEGRITNIVDFGIFVDLGGIDGLAHISELDWKKVDHPGELFERGQEISVLVKDIDLERGRVSLSRKELEPSPWETLSRDLAPGDVVECQITSIVEFGIFAEFVDGIEGLIHNNELGYSEPEKLKSLLKPGDRLNVKILSIDLNRERVSLSLRQVLPEQQVDWLIDRLDAEPEEGV